MRSMTGYGKGISRNENFEVSVELKSVNNRFLDLNVRLPKELSHEENPVRELVKSRIKRGKVSIFIKLKQNPQSESGAFINWEEVQKNYNQLKVIQEKLGLGDSIRLDHLLAFQDIFTPDLETIAEEQIHPLIFEALEKALEEFIRMSEREGRNIFADIEGRVKKIEKLTHEIQELAPQNLKSEFDRLYKNVLNLISEKNLENSRLEQEIAIISDRVDITEECVRLLSHIDLFKITLTSKDEVGKRMNFILQEMHREANTINSKTTMLEISHRIIQVKEEIEKLREQVQNIE